MGEIFPSQLQVLGSFLSFVTMSNLTPPIFSLTEIYHVSLSIKKQLTKQHVWIIVGNMFVAPE